MKRIIVTDADWIPVEDPRHYAVQQDFARRRERALTYINKVDAYRTAKLCKVAGTATIIAVWATLLALLIG